MDQPGQDLAGRGLGGGAWHGRPWPPPGFAAALAGRIPDRRVVVVAWDGVGCMGRHTCIL